jgi:hypothetical protein
MRSDVEALHFHLPEQIPSPGSKNRSQTHLHEQLKSLYSSNGKFATEVKVGSWYADVQRGSWLVEIQTRSFSALKSKLAQMLKEHPVRLVTTIPVEKMLIRFDRSGRRELSRRRSPKRGKLEDVFEELVYLTPLASHPHFSLEVLLTREEEHRRDDGRGAWRRSNQMSIQDRVLVEILQREIFMTPGDFLRLLPPRLPKLFASQWVARQLGIPPYLARKMTYFLRHQGLLIAVSRNRQGIQHQLVTGSPNTFQSPPRGGDDFKEGID